MENIKIMENKVAFKEISSPTYYLLTNLTDAFVAIKQLVLFCPGWVGGNCQAGTSQKGIRDSPSTSPKARGGLDLVKVVLCIKEKYVHVHFCVYVCVCTCWSY